MSRVITRPFRIVEREAIVDRHANFVSVKISRLEEAYIVCRDDGQPAFFRKCDRRMEIALFVLATGADQLQIITIREILLIERDALIHQRAIAAQQAFTDIAHTAARDQQQPFVQLSQPVPVDPRAQRTISALIGF